LACFITDAHSFLLLAFCTVSALSSLVNHSLHHIAILESSHVSYTIWLASGNFPSHPCLMHSNHMPNPRHPLFNIRSHIMDSV
jgi:hypothetical protein